MSNALPCPNQLQQHGIVIEDCPRQFDQSSSHSFFIPSHDIRLPLSLNGIISGLVTRQPTDEELEDFSLHIKMTSSEEWDPYSIDYAFAEEKLQNDDTQMKSRNINSVIFLLPMHNLLSRDPILQLMSFQCVMRNPLVPHLLVVL